jgi:hypothetical protein
LYRRGTALQIFITSNLVGDDSSPFHSLSLDGFDLFNIHLLTPSDLLGHRLQLRQQDRLQQLLLALAVLCLNTKSNSWNTAGVQRNSTASDSLPPPWSTPVPTGS